MKSILKLGVKSKLSLILLVPIILGIYFFPDMIVILLFYAVVLTVVHIAYQLKWALKSYVKPNYKSITTFPKVSIHIPTHNEPTDVVINTIQSCLRIDYPNFEIIVLDNNTTDKQLWQPVEAFCLNKANVKFQHIENLLGFKAGALTKCLQLTDATAEYVFVVDADYLLSPTSIHKAIGIAQAENASLVQFPQNYFYHDFEVGMNEEYNHYFKAYARGSNLSQSMLATGTLSLYRIDAINQVGGWQAISITEDAEMGIKFHSKKLKTVYADIVIGQGMLPNTLKDMRVQRERWAFGNMQCLKGLVFQKGLSLVKKRDIGVQLTAWVNFLGFSFLTLLSLILISPIYNVQLLYPMAYLIGLNIGLYIVGKFLLFGITTKFYSLTHFQSFLFHLSMLDIHTFSWWDCIIGIKKPFKRTNKFFTEENAKVPPIGLAILMTLGGLLLIFKSYLILGYVFFVFASINYMGVQLILQQLGKTTDYFSNLKTVKS